MNDIEFEIWTEEHEEKCLANHYGSAEGMEVEAVKKMFGRIHWTVWREYVTYIGDGNCKTHKVIVDIQLYENVIVTKSEDIGYVHKRMGFRLRNLKKKQKFKRGALTINLINKPIIIV